MKSLPVRLFVVLAVLVLALLVGLMRLPPGKAAADSISRSFNGAGTIQSGQVVAVSLSDKSTVELASARDPARIFGVAVDQNAAPVTVSQPGQKIFVATGGIYQVLVSTENGAIHSGDYLSMSSSDGIAAKLKASQVYIVGRALQNFDGARGATGKISAQIMPGKSPSRQEDRAVPSFLRKIAEALAGKPLSASRIYAALAIFIVTAAIAFSLLWVGIRSGMIAIGRNPLSKHSIMRSLVQVVFAAAIVFFGGLLGIYLFLRL